MPDLKRVALHDPLTEKDHSITVDNELVVSETIRTPMLAYDSSNKLEYFGKAAVGSATSSGVWQIKNFTYDSNSNLTGWLFADGNGSYDNVWDNRASLSYS